MLLTVEIEDEDVLHIHADTEGLDTLIGELTRLRNTRESNDHTHLFTQSWGGNELTETKQSKTAKLVHHVNIHKWENGVDAC